MKVVEANFDGLIGPTHNYAGLALGNVASAKNAGAVSSPRAACRQGLAKMKRLADLGLTQGFLPPLMRPHLPTLRMLGFSGSDEAMIAAAAKNDPALLANVYSASSMWTANAATVTPSSDSHDRRVHFTPANLAGNFHRAIEAEDTAFGLRTIFPHASHFTHHAPLPGGVWYGDEGAANHGRLAQSHAETGVHLYVYGEDGERFPARQRRRASEAVARGHGVKSPVFVQQARAALDAGAFHNDVVAVANERVLFVHEQAFEDREGAYAAIRAAAPFVEIVEAPANEVSLKDAVGSYLFNSQLVTLPSGEMALILPKEAEENPRTKAFLDKLIAGNGPVRQAMFLDVRESMRNGGGPACLRLRVVLSEDELRAVHPSFLLTDALYAKLDAWAARCYRDRLAPDDLCDPEFAREALEALDQLTDILGVRGFYAFQR